MGKQRDDHPLPRVHLGPHFEAHPYVFPASAGVIILAVAICFLWPGKDLLSVFGAIRDWIGVWFGWLYIGMLTAFLGFALWLAVSRAGSIRLGGDDERPEFRWWSWFAMLYSAGMGIGLLFFSVAEPISHFLTPPPGYDDNWTNTDLAMAVTVFHWGLHPWALYAVVGLMLGYAGFRLKLPLTFRSLLYPWLGDRVWGRAGDLVDALAVIATLAGVATSLGIGAKQVNAGLAYLFGVPISPAIQVVLIVLITGLATVSVVAGLDAGIRRLSEINIALAVMLLLLVIFGGGVGLFFGALANNVVDYLQVVPTKSFRSGVFLEESRPWLNSWTVFYWAWWISWSPFVGTFIARVSRGRTIREFVFGVLLVPTVIGSVWFSAFGNATLRQHQAQVQSTKNDRNLASEVIESGTAVPEGSTHSHTEYWVGVRDKNGELQRRTDGTFERRQQSLTAVQYLNAPVVTADGESMIDTLSTVLFVMLEEMFGDESSPLSQFLVFIGAATATICIVLFFVTSSDSASMVIDMIASGGNPDPPVGTRLFWAISEGLVAAALLVAGGLLALQAAAVAAALPLTLVLIASAYAFTRALRRESASKQ
jgi:choline/glycine/proline betaine transport protein